MTTHEYVLGLVDAGRQARRPPVIGMNFLHERAMSPRDLISRRVLVKSQDFISFILGHRADASAIGAPAVAITLVCRTPVGKPAVEISFK